MPRAAFVDAGKLGRALELHEREGKTQQAELDFATRSAAHFFETANAPDSALEILTFAGHYDAAAALAEKLQRFARARELYHEAGNDKKAAGMFALAGDGVRGATSCTVT